MNIGNLDVGINVDTKGLADGLKSAGEKVSNTNKLFGGFVITLADVMNVAGKVVNVMMSFVNAAGEAESAERRLADSMKDQEIYSDKALRTNIEYAKSLQKITTYDDEAIVRTMQLLTTFGLHDEQLRKTTNAVLNLSSAKGIDLVAATNLVGKAFLGETSTLSRYGIVIDDNIPKTEKFAAALKQIPMGVATGETTTYLGKVKQLENNFGELKETIGNLVIPTFSAFIGVLNKAASILSDPDSAERGKRYAKLIEQQKERIKLIEEENEIIKKSRFTTKEAISESLEFNNKEIERLNKLIKKYSELEEVETHVSATAIANSKKEKEIKIQNDRERTISYVEMMSDIAAKEEKDRVKMEKNLKNEVDKFSNAAKKKQIATENLRDKQEQAVNAFGNVLSNFQSFQNQQIQNDLTNKINANNADYTSKKTTLDQKYEADLVAIENSKLSEKEKTDALSKLNENYNNAVTLLETGRSDMEKKLRDDSAEEEKKRRQELKPFLIAEAVANTALGVTKAFAQQGVLAFITGALIAAAGAIQISMIEAQKFAKGVRNFAGGYAIIGEEGPELTELPQGSNVYTNPETKKMLGGSSQKNNFNIVVNAVVRSDEDWDKVTRNKIIPSLERYMKKTYESPFA